MLKFAINAVDDGLVGQQVFAGEATRLAYGTDEAAEGRDAFLEKRDPDWAPVPLAVLSRHDEPLRVGAAGLAGVLADVAGRARRRACATLVVALAAAPRRSSSRTGRPARDGRAAHRPRRRDQRLHRAPRSASRSRADAVLANAAASESALGGPGQWVLALPTHYIAGLNVLARSIAAETVPVTVEGEHFTADALRRGDRAA